MFGYTAPCEIDVKIQKVENRKNGQIKDKQGNIYKAPVFMVSHCVPLGRVEFSASDNKLEQPFLTLGPFQL